MLAVKTTTPNLSRIIKYRFLLSHLTVQCGPVLGTKMLVVWTSLGTLGSFHVLALSSSKVSVFPSGFSVFGCSWGKSMCLEECTGLGPGLEVVNITPSSLYCHVSAGEPRKRHLPGCPGPTWDRCDEQMAVSLSQSSGTAYSLSPPRRIVGIITVG